MKLRLTLLALLVACGGKTIGSSDRNGEGTSQVSAAPSQQQPPAPGAAVPAPVVPYYDGGSPIIDASPPAMLGGFTAVPSPGSFLSCVEVQLVTWVPDGVIHFTLDGSEPSAESSRYETPLMLLQTTTVRAVVIAPNAPPSPVFTGTYVLNVLPSMVMPIDFAPAAGSYPTGPFSVRLTSPTAGARTCYTLDGSVPTCTSASCTADAVTITLSGDTRVRAVACTEPSYDAHCPFSSTRSELSEATYTFTQ